MRTMRACGALAAAALVTCGSLGARQDRAQQIMARARAAIGGQPRLDSIRSLSVTGTLVRVGGWMFAAPSLTNDEERVYDVTVEIQLPDKYVAITGPAMGVITTDRLDGVSGDRLIARDQRRADYVSPTLILDITAERRREFSRYLLAWLLSAPPSSAVEFIDGGQRVVEGQQLNCVEARGAMQLAVSLVFDAQARLVMMAYEALPLRSPSAERVAPAGRKGGLFVSIDESRATLIRLSEHRVEDGIVFPHRMTITMAGRMREDWRIKRFKVNPKLDLKHFEPTIFTIR